MHIVSVVTLLLGSIFAYTLAAPQFVPNYYPINMAALTTALSQLAHQLAQQTNSTVRVGNNSVIVSGISNSIANANADPHRHQGVNPGWNPGWNGVWRGVPEYDNLPEEFELEGSDEDYQGIVEEEEPIGEEE